MATDISPVFGFTPLTWMDATLVTLVIGVGSIIALLIIHHRQHSLQQKLVSAQLSLKMLKYWDGTDSQFESMMRLVPRDYIIKPNPSLDHYFAIWEEIAVFCNEKTITKTHFNEFFRADLMAIYGNKSVYNYLEKEHTDEAYNNLWELIQETRKTYGQRPPAFQPASSDSPSSGS